MPLMQIQQALDAAEAAGGGVVNVPVGDYRSQGRIVIPSGVELVGSGIGTTISCVQTRPAPSSQDGRRYFIRLEGLAIAGDASDGPLGYIGADFRETTQSTLRRLYIQGIKTAILLAGAAYYNTVDQMALHASVDGVELYNGANQNTFTNVMTGSPVGFNIIDSNGNTIVGGSGEGATPGNFIRQSGTSAGTAVTNFRGESPGWGPVWCNAANLQGNF